MSQQIQNWLQNTNDYHAGVELYERHGDNSALKRILKTGPSVFNQEKLHQELKKIASKTTSIGQSNNIGEGIGVEKKTAYSADFLALEKETKRNFGELSFLKSQLKNMTSEERKAACLRIINEFYEVLHPAWEKLDYYRKHGRFADEAIKVAIQISDPVMLVKMKNNLRSYLSKAGKGKMDVAKIPQWQAELEEIERKLSDL